MEWCLSRTKFTDAQLVALGASMAGGNDEAAMGRAMAGERAFALGTLERIRSGKMNPSELLTMGLSDEIPSWRMTLAGVAYKASGLFDREARFLIEAENAMVATARQPLNDRVPSSQSLSRQLENKIVSDRYVLASMFLPSLARSIEKDTSHIIRVRVAQTAIAVERYRLANGRLPAMLADLVPTHLPAVPDDPFSGQSLHYVVKTPGFIVYSVGPDREDNHGTKTNKDGRELQPGTDIVFRVAR
jgi:hypothetical protein